MSASNRTKLCEIADFVSGGTPSRKNPEYFKGKIPWITSADLNGNVVDHAREYITDEAIEESATNVVPKGNILLVTRTGVGKVAVTGVDICISQDFTGIIPDKSQVDLWYLFFCLKAKQEYFVNSQRGATIQGITREVVSDLCIPLPPLPEQQRIAAILEKADRLRRLRCYALETGETFLQSVFLEMFYTKASADWPKITIAEVARKGKNAIRTGPFGSQLLHSEFVNSGIAVLGIDNAVQNRFAWGQRRFITEEKYKQLKRYTVYPGDVIITIMGTTGRCAIIPEDIPTAINTKHLCCITLDQKKCLPTYLQATFLGHPSVLQQLGVSERGAIMAGLNMGIIKDLVIPLPPMHLQEMFDRIVQREERLLSQQKEAVRQAEHLFQTLLHRVFNNQL